MYSRSIFAGSLGDVLDAAIVTVKRCLITHSQQLLIGQISPGPSPTHPATVAAKRCVFGDTAAALHWSNFLWSLAHASCNSTVERCLLTQQQKQEPIG